MMALRRVRLLLSMLVLSAGVSAAADEVPAPAREAFERGLAATEQQQWGLAIRYFGEAQKAAQTAPAILFNLGLAHGKAGHELPAIAWLQAYLAQAGQPANADAVRKEILRLEIATEAEIARVAQQAVAANAAAAALEPRGTAKAYVLAGIGDVDGAIRTGVSADDAWSHYATFLAFTGLVEKAEEAAGHISDVTRRNDVYPQIAEALIHRVYSDTDPFPLDLRFPRSRADLVLARAAAMKIQKREFRAYMLVDVLCEDFRREDVSLAEMALAQLAPDSSENTRREFLLIMMIEDAVQHQEFEAAIQFAERLIKLTARRRGVPFSGTVDAVRAIPARQLERGDVEGARATAQRLLPISRGLHRAGLEAVLGNYEAAGAIAPTLQCTTDEKVGLFRWIIFTQVTTGDLAGAKASAKTAAAACAGTSYDSEIGYLISLTNAFLRKRDLAGAVAVTKEGGAGASEEAALDFVRRAGRVEELVAIERAASSLHIVDHRQAHLHLALADAYEGRQMTDEAARLRLQAARFFLANMNYAEFEPAASAEKMAQALAASGDSAGARLISAAAAPDPLLAAWINAGRKLASDDVATNLPKMLSDVGTLKPFDAGSRLNHLVLALAGRLFALRGAALRAAQQ